jgi:hypothetical protein
MRSEMTAETVAVRDQAGTWNVLTPELPATARATGTQQAALEQ